MGAKTLARKMIRPDKSSIAMTVFGILLIGSHFAMICLARDLASYRASLSEYFMLPSERADQAIELLIDHRAFVIFSGSSVLLMALIPILVRLSKSKPWIGVLVAIALYIPGLLYGREILHLSAKIIDYSRLLHDSAEQRSKQPGATNLRRPSTPASRRKLYKNPNFPPVSVSCSPVLIG